MTTGLGRRKLLVLGTASFVVLHGCEAPATSVGEMPTARTISYTDAEPVSMSADFTFDTLDLDGDDTVLTAVSVTKGGATITADELRITDFAQDIAGRMSGERIVATGVRYGGGGKTSDGDDEGEPTWKVAPVLIDTVRIDDFRYRRPDQDGDSEEAERRALASLLSSVAFSQLTVDGTVIGGSDAERMTVEGVRIGGYEDGVLGAVDIANVVALTPQTDPLAALPTDPANPAAGLLASPLVKMALTKSDRTEIDRIRLGGADISGLMGDLAAAKAPGPGTPDVTVGDIRIDGQRRYIGERMAQTTARTDITGISFDGVLPTAAVAKTRGSVTDMTAYTAGDERVAGVLRQRGLQKLKGSSKASFVFDPDAGVLSVTASGEGDDFYAGTFSLDASGLQIAPSGLAKLPDTDDIVVERMTVSLTDEQAIATAFDLLAIDSPSSAMEIKQQTIGLVTLGALQGGAVSPRVPTYAGALSSFIANGGTLTIRVRPDGGVSAAAASAMASDPATLIEALDLTIERSD